MHKYADNGFLVKNDNKDHAFLPFNWQVYKIV